MKPEIEELPDDYDVDEHTSKTDNSTSPKRLPKRNPFADEPKKKTIKRSADEVYSQHKGLNKPQFNRNKPIDALFEQLEMLLNLSYDQLTVEILEQRIFNENTSNGSRFRVVEYLLDKLLDIQRYSLEPQFKDKSIIAISLHDVKTFSKLINTIIIHGVYPALNVFHIGIPFEKRTLKDANQNRKSLTIDKIGEPKSAIELLELIYEKLFVLFQTPSDVTGLLSKGSGLSDFVTIAIALNTIPNIDHSKYIAEYPTIEKLPDTFELFQVYSLLLASPSPGYFKTFVVDHLQLLHYKAPRGDGLLGLIEYVLGIRDQDEIDITRFDHVANIVLSKPKSITTKDYFTSIGNQFYDLLVNINRPTVTSCVTYVLEKLWGKNTLVVRDFFLKRVWDNFNPESENTGVLITEAQLNNEINVLLSLSRKGLEPDFYKAVMAPITVPIWGYYLFLKRNAKSVEVITNILTTYFTVMKDFDTKDLAGVDLIAKNLCFEGGENWRFAMGPNNLVQIETHKNEITFDSKEFKVNKFIVNLDFACTNFITLLGNVDDDIIQGLFVRILKQWLAGSKLIGNDEESPFIKLVDLKLLESIGEKFKESLARTPSEMLLIVQSFLNSEFDEDDDTMQDSDDEDGEKEEILPVLLELLSAVLSENDVVIDDQCTEHLSAIKTSLSNLAKQIVNENIKRSARALESRITDIMSGDIPVTDAIDAQKLTLSRAITSLNDPLAPIRAHGLYLLRQLIESKSEVISLDFVINLHLVQLKDPEPFVYLNVIKGLESLIQWDEPVVLKTLCELYVNQETELDERLRIGEVILRYIQVSNETFQGDLANLIVESTLSIIRRHDADDDRVRMSAMSLLGTCCKVNPIGLIGKLEDALDCAIGILSLEINNDKAIMRRSAVVLIQDLILGTSETDKIQFPENYREKVITILKYVASTDNDIFVREQAQKVLELIEELFKLAMDLYFERNK
ncbi:hypothetical protein CORT_0G03020 [Candida orthopsilosis Co 90-125]|uniref:RNA polymerase II assembly factor Rtp1 C-terminal domain-containing protein n=1 Tax=Candida orthopsilosis (strain 90-125) TaxID=1136231 RepID=H8XA03_CANO9|nr:hypothetical protein CORT_0G03020 [Candida orthopsilosis Co 90-125]CCG24980.1 hypothetical protein CORT_0G03020 [Candida orthopsilosis Co 90-125]